MKKHPVLLGILILLAVVYGSSALNMSRAPIPSVRPAQTTASPEKKTSERTVEMVRSIVASHMPTATVESRYDEENGLVFVDIIQNDMDGEFARQARDDVGDFRIAWNRIAKDAVEIQKSVQEILTTMGMEDTVAVLDILNADNTDEVLLSVANGVVGYDVVNGIDLLNQSEG